MFCFRTCWPSKIQVLRFFETSGSDYSVSQNHSSDEVYLVFSCSSLNFHRLENVFRVRDVCSLFYFNVSIVTNLFHEFCDRFTVVVHRANKNHNGIV